MNIATDLTVLEAFRDKRCIVMLLRHGERESVPSHAFPRHDAPLTESGWLAATSLGKVLGERLHSVRSSPVPRCMDTARALLAGAKKATAPQSDRLLGDPGAYVVNGDQAMSSMTRLGFHPAMRRLGDGEQMPGFSDPDVATKRILSLAQWLLVGEPSGVHVLVTHDSFLATLVARIRGRALEESEWPDYLHGAAVWVDDRRYMSQYHAVKCSIPDRLLSPESLIPPG